MLQRRRLDSEMDQADGDDDDCLAVPFSRPSEHSAATSSAPEVEDCDDLEVVEIQPDDSSTNILGETWNEEARSAADRVDGGGSFTEIEGPGEMLGRTVGPDDNGSDNGEPRDATDKPAVAVSLQSSTRIGSDLNQDRFGSAGNSDSDSDDGDKNVARDEAAKPTLAAFRQSSVQSGELGEIADQSGGSGNHHTDKDDDFDDDDDDDDEPQRMPTFSPFSALMASAGGDHLSTVANDAKEDILENKNSVSLDSDPAPGASPVTVAVPGSERSTGTIHKDQSFYGASSDDEKGSEEEEAEEEDDDDDNDKVGGVYEKNRAVIPSKVASNSFDVVFARNLDPLQKAVNQNGTAVQADVSRDDVCRSKSDAELDDFEDLEETMTSGPVTASVQPRGMGLQTATVWNSYQAGVDCDEQLETLDDKTGKNDVKMTNNLPARHHPTHYEVHGKQAKHEVTIYYNSI